MAWRAIQDTVGTSESLAQLSDRAERLWWRLLAHSDPWGRLDARPRKLRAVCYPMLPQITDTDAGRCLLELQQAGRIVVWEKDGQHTVQIVDFEKNQPREAFRKRASSSRYPQPPASLKPVENLIETLYKLNSGPTPEPTREVAAMQGFPETFRSDSGNVPDERRGDKTRREGPTSSSVVARASDTAPDDDDDLLEELLALRPTPAQRERWTTALQNDPGRVHACLTKARASGRSIPGYLDTLIENGSHPLDHQDLEPVLTLPRCPECGPIGLPPGTTLADHRRNVHGIDSTTTDDHANVPNQR